MNLCAEEYRQINNHDNYMVSNKGNVKNIITNKILKCNFDGYYVNVNITDNDGKQSTKRVHVLVASAFLDNPNNYKCVDHIDLNKINNNVNNLRYVSYTINRLNCLKTKKECSSKFKGVCYDKKRNKWRASFCGQYLGHFETEVQAALKYNQTIADKIELYIVNNNIINEIII